MKKAGILILALVLLCTFAFPAFAADDPGAAPTQTLTVVIPGKPVYKIDVVNGHAEDGAGNTITSAAKGDTVTLVAHSFPGYTFDKWVKALTSPAPADASKATTTFVMPARAVKYSAAFVKDAGSEGGSASSQSSPSAGSEPSSPGGSEPSSGGSASGSSTPAKPVPVTGDESHILFYGAAAAASLAAVVLILRKRNIRP